MQVHLILTLLSRRTQWYNRCIKWNSYEGDEIYFFRKKQYYKMGFCEALLKHVGGGQAASVNGGWAAGLAIASINVLSEAGTLTKPPRLIEH